MSFPSHIARTTTVQRDTILRLMREYDADQFLVEFDEDYDTWFFLTLFRDRKEIVQTVVEADGSVEDEDYEPDAPLRWIGWAC